MAEVSGDWLNADPRDSDSSAAARDAQRLKDIESAQLYYAAFVASVAVRKLLESWDSEIANLRVGVNASLSEYVAAESYRSFVRKIHEKIKLVSTEGKQ